jgi:hypothetical protein
MSRKLTRGLAVLIIVLGALTTSTPASAMTQGPVGMCTLSCPPKSGCVLCGGSCTDLPSGAVVHSCLWVCGGTCAEIVPDES